MHVLGIYCVTVLLCCIASGTTAAARGVGAPLGGLNETLPGPATPADAPAWLKMITAWRSQTLKAANFNSTIYDEYLLWTPSSFISPQVMLHEQTLFNRSTGKYTVDAYLDDLERRYGGIDSVLVWGTYPNIGIDASSQFDMFLNLPGGVEGTKQLVADFHARGVHVLFPYNPWDQGTMSNGKPDYVTLPGLLAQVHADGFNGDTMSVIPGDFWTNGLADGNPLALEPEVPAIVDTLSFTKMGWGYWFVPHYNFVPMVDKYKWLESRHITHICNRWAWNHTDDIQHAFFNGDGFVSWENVWGIWQGMTPRDEEATRRMSAMQRFFASAFVSPEWEPHTVGPMQHGLYASKWPMQADDQVLWTMVNRMNVNMSGPVFSIPAPPRASTLSYFDCYHGNSLSPSQDSGNLVFSLDVEELGFACVLQIPSASVTPDLREFLKSMSTMTATSLSSYSTAMVVLPQQIIPIDKAPQTSLPPGMTRISATTEYSFQVHGIMVETDNDRPGVDFQYPWETFPTLYHNHTMVIEEFFIDTFPVTNQDYADFMTATEYTPTDAHNFLHDWKNGTFPSGWAMKPVTWVGLEDARSYCRWAGKRLPNEWEWQYAAQGNSSPPNKYPWGNDWDPSRVPTPDHGRELTSPDNVDAHPTGASPFGVMDLVGNVYQWTNEYTDPHTRAAALKGGCYYHPQGSQWYFPEATALDTHGKYLLMAPSLDRAGTLGFRCAADHM